MLNSHYRNDADFMNIDKQIKKALDRFSKQTGLDCSIQSYWIVASIDETFDAFIVITIGSAQYPYWVNYNQQGKKRLKSGKIENVLEMGDLSTAQKNKFLEKKTPFIANDGEFSIPITLSNIKSNHVRPAQTAGNVTAQAVENTFPSSESMARFIHFLAATHPSPKRTQRVMADEIGISTPAVNKYLKELQDANYIVNGKTIIRLVDPGKLLELWAVEYIKKILPRVEKHYFDAYDDKQFHELRANPIMLKNGYWSAVKAADILTRSELPENFVIYTDKPHEVVKELRLRPSKTGKIEIRKKFWNFDWKEKYKGIVDLPLIYADLMNSDDPRDLKTAREMREIWIRSLSS
jgi:DNA-binding Lrp family transcriptional regulator